MVAVASVTMPISVFPAGYVTESAIFFKSCIVLVRLMLLVTPPTTIDAVSLKSALAETQPMKSTMAALVISKSPSDLVSIEYSSVVAPTATTDHPFVVLSGRSFTCGACPVP